MQTGKMIDLPFGPMRQTTWLQALFNRADDSIKRQEQESNWISCFAHIAKGMRKCKRK